MVTKTYPIDNNMREWFPQFMEWLDQHVNEALRRTYPGAGNSGGGYLFKGPVRTAEWEVAVEAVHFGMTRTEGASRVVFQARHQETPDGDRTKLVVIYTPSMVSLWNELWLQMTKAWPLSFPLPGAQKATPTPDPSGIPDPRWRRAVEMLREGRRISEIAVKLGLSEKRVGSRLSELRKEHGSDVVPYRRHPAVAK